MSSYRILDSTLAKSLIGREAPHELVAQNQNIVRIENLGELTSLRKVDLSYNPLKSLQGLDQLTFLRQLFVSGCKLISLDGLSRCIHLEKLCLRQNQLAELSDALLQLSKLRELRLDQNMLKLPLNLNGLTNLRILNLSNNQISSLEGINGLQYLEDIQVTNNNLTSLTGLSRLPRLKELNIGYNKLVCLNGLLELKTLEILHAEHNSITELFPSTSTFSGSSNSQLHESHQLSSSERKPSKGKLNADAKSRSSIGSMDTKSGDSPGNSRSRSAEELSLTHVYLTGNKIQQLSGIEVLAKVRSSECMRGGQRGDTLTKISTSFLTTTPPIAGSQSLEVLDIRANNISDLVDLTERLRQVTHPFTAHCRVGLRLVTATRTLSNLSEVRLSGNPCAEDARHGRVSRSDLQPMDDPASSAALRALLNPLISALSTTCPLLRLVDGYALVHDSGRPVVEGEPLSDGRESRSDRRLPGDLFYTWDDASASSTSLVPSEATGRTLPAEGEPAGNGTEEGKEDKDDDEKEGAVPPIPQPLAELVAEEKVAEMEREFKDLVARSRTILLRAVWRAESEGKVGEEGMLAQAEAALDEKERAIDQDKERRARRTGTLRAVSGTSAGGRVMDYVEGKVLDSYSSLAAGKGVHPISRDAPDEVGGHLDGGDSTNKDKGDRTSASTLRSNHSPGSVIVENISGTSRAGDSDRDGSAASSLPGGVGRRSPYLKERSRGAEEPEEGLGLEVLDAKTYSVASKSFLSHFKGDSNNANGMSGGEKDRSRDLSRREIDGLQLTVDEVKDLEALQAMIGKGAREKEETPLSPGEGLHWRPPAEGGGVAGGRGGGIRGSVGGRRVITSRELAASPELKITTTASIRSAAVVPPTDSPGSHNSGTRSIPAPRKFSSKQQPKPTVSERSIPLSSELSMKAFSASTSATGTSEDSSFSSTFVNKIKGATKGLGKGAHPMAVDGSSGGQGAPASLSFDSGPATIMPLSQVTGESQPLFLGTAQHREPNASKGVAYVSPVPGLSGGARAGLLADMSLGVVPVESASPPSRGSALLTQQDLETLEEEEEEEESQRDLGDLSALAAGIFLAQQQTGDNDPPLSSPRYTPVTRAENAKRPPPQATASNALGRRFKIPEGAKQALAEKDLMLSSSRVTAMTAASLNPFLPSSSSEATLRAVDLEESEVEELIRSRKISPPQSSLRSHSSFI